MAFDNNPYLDQVTNLRQKMMRWSSHYATKSNLKSPSWMTMKTRVLESMGMTEAGLDRVIRAGYELLNMQTYFTAGSKKYALGRSKSVPLPQKQQA